MLPWVLLTLTMIASSKAAVPETLSEAAINAFLQGHNKLRSSLGIPNLVWNSTLASFAESHGSKCLWQHSYSKYGENLYASSPQITDNVQIAAYAIDEWASEVKNVNPTWACIFVMEGTCGHYSQIVWKNTKNLGCAVVHCSSPLENFVVCEYNPPGNFVKQIPY